MKQFDYQRFWEIKCRRNNSKYSFSIDFYGTKKEAKNKVEENKKNYPDYKVTLKLTLNPKEDIQKLAGNQARIALMAIKEGKTMDEAIKIAQTYPPEK